MEWSQAPAALAAKSQPTGAPPFFRSRRFETVRGSFRAVKPEPLPTAITAGARPVSGASSNHSSVAATLPAIVLLMSSKNACAGPHCEDPWDNGVFTKPTAWQLDGKEAWPQQQSTLTTLRRALCTPHGLRDAVNSLVEGESVLLTAQSPKKVVAHGLSVLGLASPRSATLGA